jgi:RNA polymerase sigma-70 factor (ECF subfamily)
MHLLKESNFAHLDLEADLEKAFRLIHTKLEPLERAAYLLKEAFDVDYDALQAVFDKKKEHCRQLVSRAKKKLNEEKERIQLDLPDFGPLMDSFRKSCEIGNPKEFIQELKNDISRSKPKKA